MNYYDVSKARLFGVLNTISREWPQKLPQNGPQHLGTILDPDKFRIAVAFRLGAIMCQEYTCYCGTNVKNFGLHGLSCRNSYGRRLRHCALNETIRRALSSAGILDVLEPVSLLRNCGKWSDCLTLAIITLHIRI